MLEENLKSTSYLLEVHKTALLTRVLTRSQHNSFVKKDLYVGVC